MNAVLMTVDWNVELLMCGRILLAAFLGALVGIEREYHHKDAGIRTFAGVAMGACLFALISSNIAGADPARMASNIVVGIGFLGGGLIIHQNNRTTGLTTAAMLWVNAAVGTAVGVGMIILPVFVALLMMLILTTHHFFGDDGSKPKN